MLINSVDVFHTRGLIEDKGQGKKSLTVYSKPFVKVVLILADYGHLEVADVLQGLLCGLVEFKVGGCRIVHSRMCWP